ncbi:AAA family ATPase [Actinomadura sp. WMMB 499]|uniref:AAA family ATPase n=1 Tax=Actinomadura sp. WMMB 499 TaxID=1219491 RepID=UPI0020C816B8|nr:AAA family ATPase [Actinomadura sp. WMMB 499]
MPARAEGPVGLRLGFAGDDFGYAIDFGLPNIGHSMFARDPEIKAEATWAGPVLRAAALQTIREIGDDAALDAAVDRAFPGSRIAITEHGGRFELALRQPGLLRPLSGAELSDGTLRYLLWTAALLTPRPPALLVLNEPETSLHPELLRPLAELIVTAAEHTQVVAVTHSRPLASGWRRAWPTRRTRSRRSNWSSGTARRPSRGRASSTSRPGTGRNADRPDQRMALVRAVSASSRTM